MPLEVLKRDVRIEHRIAIIESAHETNRRHAIGHRINERAAELFHLQRIAHRVNDCAGRQAPGGDLPQFLDADRVELRRSIPVEGEAPHRRLRQIAADAIGQNRDFRANVDARLESRLPLSLFADSAIPGANTDDAIALVEDLDGGETSKHVDTSGLDEATFQPLKYGSLRPASQSL